VAIKGRRLITTRTSLLRLATEEFEIGDIIAILFGHLLESRLDDTEAKEEL
jgi:hypothetical protein